MNGVILRAALAVTLLALAFPATSFGQAATVGASSGDTDADATVGCIAADAGAQETTAGATVGTCPSGGSNAADVGGLECHDEREPARELRRRRLERRGQLERRRRLVLGRRNGRWRG